MVRISAVTRGEPLFMKSLKQSMSISVFPTNAQLFQRRLLKGRFFHYFTDVASLSEIRWLFLCGSISSFPVLPCSGFKYDFGLHNQPGRSPRSPEEHTTASLCLLLEA